ncbi:MAG: XisI protein [Anaerolineae bacterium]|nr:XisI protein [Anaerolineae bacterium]
MDSLSRIVRETLEAYAVEGENFDSYLAVTADERLFSVIDIVRAPANERSIVTSSVVRLVGNRIVIEYDDNSEPIVDALLDAGIPREQIILAYAGEPVPEGA